jgi:hypothetical protein
LHAKHELDLVEKDEEFKACIVNAVREFAKYGHSGGSAGVGIHFLNELLQFRNLSPLTDDPNEWMTVTNEDPCWQSRRNPEAFSSDGGKTYYLLSEGSNFQHQDLIHKSEPKKE